MLPFAGLAIVFLYLAWQVDTAWSYWMVPPLVITVSIYILSPQINWWWHSKHPPELAPELTTLLERFSVFYNQLKPADKTIFRQKIALFRMGTDWTPIGWERVPDDVELALAAQAITLHFHREPFLFEKFEKVIVYPVLFPTPEHPYPHSAELYAPDGCLIFSAPELMHGFLHPRLAYNIGLHTYAEAYMASHPDAQWPAMPENSWEILEQISGLEMQQIQDILKMIPTNPIPVAIHHFFTYPETFQQTLPDIYAIFQREFNPTIS